VLLPADPAFPSGLLALERPPLRLHWQGCGGLWPLLRRRQAIAVVGTRRPSLHGLGMAEAIGAALAQAGWPVVSGLAEGIDGAVHRGCLARGGKPVAVLGTPLERVYPRHHRELQNEVAAEGLLVSELPAGTAVQAGHFAVRNRLQVGLAQAVVVVECPLRSGALHSAALAMKQELPLWVVPADAGKASAAGSNRLLAQDATVLLEPADLIRQLGPGPLAPADPPAPSGVAGLQAADPGLLTAIGHGASLEQLCLVLEQPAASLAPRLLALELQGLVRAEPGLCWRPV
jgi:DNA processing protein